MKFSVSIYSFGKNLSEDNLGIYGVIDKAAEMGFDGIEFIEGKWTEGMSLKKAKAVGEYAASKGLARVAFCSTLDFMNGSNGVLEDQIKLGKSQVDFAAALGVTNLRHDVANYPLWAKENSVTYDDCLPRLVVGCREITKYAEQLGIGTMTENHGRFSQDSCRVEKLINETNHRNFGALVDIGNFMCVDEDPVNAVRVMAKYAKHVHAKDFFYKSKSEGNPGKGWFETRGGNFLRGTIIGHGNANAYQSLQLLKSSGYDGFYTVEFEGIEDNLLGISEGLNNLKRFLL